MIGKNNHYLRDTKDGTKVESYSIKKFKVGAASVVIGASIFLGAGAVAQASEEVSNNTTADNTTNAGDKENVPTAPVATAQPVAKETTKEDVAAGLAAKLGGEVKALDKTKLESYIAEIEGKLANGTYESKTEESVAVLKEELKAAKATLADATTQDEITKAYSKLVTTANTKLKNKPVEKKETPAVDTTNGKETVGKKAENTEKKSDSNSIENTGSNDPRNGQALDKNNAFRAETTETQGTFTYSMEYSNGKEIYLYNEENADIDITVNSTAGNIKRATVKAGSGQFVLKSKSDQAIAYTKYKRGTMPPEEEVEIDGYGWSYHQTLSDTPGPVKIKITGKPNDTFKAIKTYTKTEDQRAVLGARYLELEDSNGNKLSGGSNLNAPGAFNLVVKSQTYKYDIQQPESNADKIAVSNVDSPTEADITKIKNELKIKYSDKATTEDARLASKRGEVVNPRSSVVKEIAVANGTVTVTYNDDSVDTAPVSSVARTNVAPTVSIPYSDPTPDKKDIYIYNGEEVDIDITFNDDSGKIQSASLKRGGNIALRDIGENKQDNEWGLVTTVIKNETTTPATIKITGTVTGLSDNKIPKTESQELPIASRFATATDLDGKYIENQATKFNAGTNIVSESYKTDPGAFTITLKAQTAKYDIKTPASADKVTVSDANNISNEDFEKIKAKVKIEYSNNNIDMRLADKKGKEVENPTERVERIEREGNNVVVTYKDGSKDTKALADFVNVAPKVALPYSNEANKQIYVYTGENTDLTFKGTDEKEVKDLYLRGPGDITWNNANQYGFTTGKVEDGAVTGEGSVSEDKTSATIKMTGKTNLAAGKEWTSFIVSKDNDGKLSNEDYRALDKDPNAKEKPGYARFVVKNQTSKYDIATPTEKVAVTDPANVTQDELDKIKEKLQIEYSKRNDDANLAEKKGKALDAEDAKTKIKSVEKDANGNLVVTYTDGSKDTRSLSEFVTLDKQPAIEAVEKAAEAKIDEINKTPNATDDEKQAAIDKVNADKKKALDEIAKPEVTTKEALDTAKTAGTTAIVGDNPVVAKKDAAKADVETARKAKEDAIKANPNLTQAEKDAAIAKNNTAAEEATKAIDSATTNDGVDKAKEAGTGEIAKVNPVAKEAAKKAIADELAKKEEAIDGRTDLTDEEKAAAKKDAQDKAKEATDAINAQPDSVATPEEAAKAKTAVDGAKDKGVADVKAVNPVAKAKPEAKKAIDDKLAKQLEDIANTPDATDEEKKVAADAAKALADQAKKDIDNAKKDEDVKKLQDEAKDEIEKSVPVVEDKPNARKAIEDEAKAKKEAIDARTDLTPKAKEDLKAEVDAIADQAKKAVDKATSATDVDKIEEADKAAIKAVGEVKEPVDKTLVKDPANLTDAEKAKLLEEVKKVNPTAKEVKYDEDGNIEVTTQNGDKGTIKPADIVKTEKDLDNGKGGNDINKPIDKVIVKDPANLTDAEKAKIVDEVKAVNPNSIVTIDDKGTVTVSTPDGETAAIPAAELVRTKEDTTKPDAGNSKVVKPADKVVGEATDPAAQAKVEEKLKDLNPTAKSVKFDEKGNATVTLNDGTTATIPAKDLFKSPEEAAQPNAGNDIVKPADKAVAANPEKLTDAEKKAIEDKVKAVNPGATVAVDDKGNATVTTPEGKTAVIPATDLVKSPEEATKPNAGNDINTPAGKVEVKDPAKLTDEEKAKVKKAVEDVNPGSKVVVDGKGNATVTTPEGKTAVVPAADVTKSAADADKANAGNAVNTPAGKVEVKDPAKLTDEEKAKVKKAVEDVNPGSKVVVDDKGNATVTTPEGKTATIPGADVTKSAADAGKANAGNVVNTPAIRVLVGDKAKLTADEIEKVKESVKAVNPGSTVVVDDKGNATVTTPEGKTATIPAAQLVKDAKDVAAKNNGDNINLDFEKETVVDFNNLTDAEKEAAKAKIKGANADVEEVIFDKAGNATVITKDGKVYTIAAKDIFRQKEVPTLQGKPANDGNNGTSETNGNSNAQGTNTKLGQRLANTGTTETNTGLAGLGLGILGGLLAAARRRKNDKN